MPKNRKEDHQLIKGPLDEAKEKYGADYYDVSVDEHGQGHFNALSALCRMQGLIEEAFSLNWKEAWKATDEYQDRIEQEEGRRILRSQAKVELTAQRLREAKPQIDQCAQRAKEIFANKIGKILDFEIIRIAEDSVTDAINELQLGIEMHKRLKQAIDKERELDRQRYDLRAPGRPEGSKTQKSDAQVSSEQEERLNKIKEAIRELYRQTEEDPTKRHVAAQIKRSERQLSNWLKDLGIDDWEGFITEAVRETGNEN